jgi:hypothetical protein
VPTWLEILLVALAAVTLLLALGGGIAVSRRRRRDAPTFEALLDDANRALAAAHAEDKGWEPSALQDAARAEFARERAGVEVHDMTLVQVVDRPGVEDDEAVFRFETADGGVHHLTLQRTADGWRAASTR